VKKLFCCVGLFESFIIGSMLGGSLATLAPALGFGIGLIGDIKLMRKSYRSCH